MIIEWKRGVFRNITIYQGQSSKVFVNITNPGAAPTNFPAVRERSFFRFMSGGMFRRVN